MKYSKRNVSVLLAKLRVMDLPELGYWISAEHPAHPNALYMKHKNYSEMGVNEQKANWQQFQQDVNRLTNKVNAK